MTKLYTLEDLSAFSADSMYKIGLELEQYGLTQENMLSLNGYDDIFSRMLLDLEDGHHTIIAVETQDYNATKRDIIGRFVLEEVISDEVSEIITLNAGDDVSEIDVSGHSLLPAGSLVHLSTDGLYSGFTADVLSGKLTLIPLDFMRIDGILDSLRINVMDKMVIGEDGGEFIQMPDYDFVPCVSEMVCSLKQSDKKIALATSEATMWVYNLYDKVDSLTEVINFVEIVDEDSSEYEETTAESESVRIIRHAREAMNNTDSDFGGAVSEIYSTENESGQTVYFAYAAVADRYAAKAKKINTMNPDDLSVILPHAVSVLTQIVCRKNEQAEQQHESAVQQEETQQKPEEKKTSKGIVAFAVLLFLAAIIIPVFLVFGSADKKNETTSGTVDVAGTTMSTQSVATIPSDTTTTAQNLFTPTASIGNNVTEATVTDVSAVATTTSVVSTSGTFNFYVFGYGHGVGLSQVGADYLAKNQGWNWAEILSHYYYDPNTSIVVADTYPKTIKYGGTDYDTREFLASALESEMGSSFHIEALKAQAVALYTFAKYYNYTVSDSGCAYGKTPSEKVYQAVDEIMKNGVYIAHNGSVACTPFHAMSAGVTTSYYNVWGKGAGTEVPYLSGGRKSYGDYLDPDFKQVYTITSEELKNIIKQKTGTEPSGDPATWISIISHDAGVREDVGYVSSINVNGKIYTGNDFRGEIMSGALRSHCFTIEYIPTASAAQ